mmetsp:Transcript_91150/g.276776  ORF Transcript_91150/g.276776 Transcript_91150/m.276776 type:complete len:321 (+) Transcript_91150:67-1029(+)
MLLLLGLTVAALACLALSLCPVPKVRRPGDSGQAVVKAVPVGVSADGAIAKGTSPMAVPFDCGDSGAWSLQKKDWCCQNRRLGCPKKGAPAAPAGGDALPFDCGLGLSSWWLSWSPKKKDWCCKHRQLGCPTTQAPPGFAGPTTAPALYDCGTDLGSWQTSWVDAKKAWCCKSHQLDCSQLPADGAPSANCGAGCPTMPAASTTSTTSTTLTTATTSTTTTTTGTPTTTSTSTTISTASPTTTTTPLYNCRTDYSQVFLKISWSSDKRRWCCEHAGRGCTTTPTPEPYDCMEGFFGWKKGWAEDKKKWCCEHKDRGCPGS